MAFRTKKFWIPAIFGLILVCLGLGIWIAKHYAEKRLSAGFRFSGNEVRIINPKIHFNGSVTADTVLYSSDKAKVIAARPNIQLRLRGGFLLDNMAVEVDIKSVDVQVAKSEKKDSLPIWEKLKPIQFPKLRSPIPVSLDVSELQIHLDTLGPIDLEKLSVSVPKSQKASLSVAQVTFQSYQARKIELAADWRNSDSLFANLGLESQFGELKLLAKAPKKNLLETAIHLEAHSDSLPSELLKVKQLTSVTQSKLILEARLLKTPQININLRTRVSLSKPATTQEIRLQLNYQDSSGTFELRAWDREGRQASTSGKISNSTAFQLKELPDWVQGFAAQGQAEISAWKMAVGKKQLPLSSHIESFTVDTAKAIAEVKTQAGSRISLEASWRKGIDAQFRGTVSPTEPWALIWTDTNITYKRAAVQGRFRDGIATANINLWQAKAYGVQADSFFTQCHIGGKGYYLDEGTLFEKGIRWDLQGQVEWPKGGTKLAFNAMNPKYGELQIEMPRMSRINVRIDKLVPSKLPMPLLNKSSILSPSLTGVFNWDMKSSEGYTEMNAELSYEEQALQLELMGGWDKEALTVSKLNLKYSGDLVQLNGKVKLHGRKFFELKKVGLKDIEYITLAARDFELGSLKAFLNKEKLKENPKDWAGNLSGAFTYSGEQGFAGAFELNDARFQASNLKITSDKFEIIGSGENVLLRGKTRGDKMWLNDSLFMEIGGILSKEPDYSIDLLLGNTLWLRSSGKIPNLSQLEGTLSLSGSFVLPNEIGTLRKTKLSAVYSIPIKPFNLEAVVVKVSSLETRLVSEKLDTLMVKAQANLEKGMLNVSPISIATGPTQSLEGEFEMKLGQQMSWSGDLRGNTLSYKWAGNNQVDLEGVTLHFATDNTNMKMKLKLGSLLYEMQKGALKVSANLKNISANYNTPVSKTNQGRSHLKLDADIANLFIQHKIWKEVLGLINNPQKSRNSKKSKRESSRPLEMDISVRTLNKKNRIESDVLRANWVGDMHIKGVWPYVLLTGEISGVDGHIGWQGQDYSMRELDVAWNNRPIPEGRLFLEGTKALAKSCEPNEKDSCEVSIKLEGQLNELSGNFSYESTCSDATEQGIGVTGLLNTVRRGCYDSELTGENGPGFGGVFGGIIEGEVSRVLTRGASRLSYDWIKTAKVSGISGLFAAENPEIEAEAIAVEITSKAKWGVSLRGKLGYYPKIDDPNPYEFGAGAEWSLPFDRLSNDKWRERLADKVVAEAAIETDNSKQTAAQPSPEIRQRVGLRYRLKFWELW